MITSIGKPLNTLQVIVSFQPMGKRAELHNGLRCLVSLVDQVKELAPIIIRLATSRATTTSWSVCVFVQVTLIERERERARAKCLVKHLFIQQ